MPAYITKCKQESSPPVRDFEMCIIRKPTAAFGSFPHVYLPLQTLQLTKASEVKYYSGPVKEVWKEWRNLNVPHQAHTQSKSRTLGSLSSLSRSEESVITMNKTQNKTKRLKKQPDQNPHFLAPISQHHEPVLRLSHQPIVSCSCGHFQVSCACLRLIAQA